MSEEATITVRLSKAQWLIIRAALLGFEEAQLPFEESDVALQYHTLKAQLDALVALAWR